MPKGKPCASTEKQREYIAQGLRLSKAEIGSVVGREINKIASLTRQEAGFVIGLELERIAMQFTPGSAITIEASVDRGREDDDCSIFFKGAATIKGYEIFATEHTCMLRALLTIPALGEVRNVDLATLKKHAVLVQRNDASETDVRETLLRKYQTCTLRWQLLKHKLRPCWKEAIHRGLLQTKALNAQDLKGGVFVKIMRGVLDYLDIHAASTEKLTDEDIIEAIRNVHGHVIWEWKAGTDK
ncbi:MAG: hypothetical protein PHW10_00565 [Candidatus Peribacteraceae bacterium]|nr:hypothetical protein [Candidatus Peribacteraceae bacterium]